MRRFAKWFYVFVLLCMTNALNATDYKIGQRFTSVAALEGQAFAIINEADGNKVLYGTDNQNLGYDVFSAAFVDTNTGYLFKLESSTIAGCYLLRLQTPTGTGYSIWGGPGYLNTQPTDKWCSFIAPLGTQNGTDIENGAVWEIQYVENKGFTLLNKGTNLFLTSNAPAKYETPAYFTFCTISPVSSGGGKTFENAEGTITWNVGNETSGTVSTAIDGAFSNTSVATGNGLTVETATYFDTEMVKYTPSTSNAGNVASVMIEYTVQAADGVKFQPTQIDYAAVKVGSDNATYSWSYTIDGVESEITEIDPNPDLLRNNGANGVENNGTAQLMHSETITAAACETFTLRFYISKTANNKNICIGKVTISGIANSDEQPESPDDEEYELVEIPQDQGASLDDFERAELVEGEGYNTYTATANLMVAFKMYDIDVKDCDYVVVKFAEPVTAGWELAFWGKNDNSTVAVPAGATEYKYVFAEDSKCAIQNDVLPQICMVTLWGGQKPLVAKVTGIYKHHKVIPVPVDEEFVAAKTEYELALSAAKAALIDEDYTVVTGAEKTTLANVVASYESIANPTTELYNTATAALIVTTKMFMGAKVLYDVQTIYQDYLISGVRYWFDSNYTPQNITYQAGEVIFDVSALSDGFHTLHYQVIDNHGGLSPVRTSSFFRVQASNDGVNADYTLASVRYWFDSDESSQTMTYSAGATTFDASALPEGFHTLHYQIADNRGGLSPVRTSSFMRIAAASEAITTDYEVTGIRYWFDQDASNAKTGTYASGICSVDASALEAGVHTLHYQVLTSDGTVSPVRSSSFTLTSVIVLNENSDFALLADIEDADVQLNLSVSSQVWDAVILPFSLTNQQVKDLFGSNALVATLEGEEDNKMQFQSSTNGISANQPFLLRPDVTASSFSVNGIRLCKPVETSVEVGNHVMAGNYHAGVTVPTGSYLYVNGELTASDGSHTLKSFHTLLSAKDGASFIIEVDGVDPLHIDLADWHVLKSVYENNGGEDWTRQWTFGDAPTSSRDLPGIRVVDGKVTYIDLSDNGLVGSFPITLLSLPSLQELNLSTNQLSGSLHQILASYLQTNSNFTSAVRTLNISHNQLSGNIGALAQRCPQLQSLIAGYNQLENVTPAISEQVTTLDLGRQNIQNAVALSLSELTAASLIEKTPNILRYNHLSQSYDSNARWLLTTSTDNWSLLVVSLSGELSMPWVSTQNAYHGASGAVLNVALVDANRQPLGGTFPLCLSFDAGDGNFDGQVDVLDLQATINYMFEEYEQKPFNFTASNLWNDEVINVQDAVCLVNILMDAEVSSAREVSFARSFSVPYSEPDACAFIENGQLFINSSIPVSAFDIVISTNQKCEILSALKEIGFTCNVKQSGEQLHLIGYSLSGSTLPVGICAIGNVGDGIIDYVKLADQEAEEIVCSVGASTTMIALPNVPKEKSSEAYRISLGMKHAISIDTTGKKTMIKNEK